MRMGIGIDTYHGVCHAHFLENVAGLSREGHRTQRTSNSRLLINPLMAMCWGLELGAVARRCLYLQEILETQTPFEITLRIEAFRERTQTRPWQELPV